MFFGTSVMIRHARAFAMQIGTTKLFGTNDFACSSLNLQSQMKMLNGEVLIKKLTRGGPARKIVPLPCTMTLSSAMAGM